MSSSREKHAKCLFVLLAANGALVFQVILEFIVAIALATEDEMLARLDHDCLAGVLADHTNHVLW